ncbi:hypothetical protein O3M35_008424 [Rhynocoris fuscipes]|uniref:RHD domain-containing protein n=1 Tax=Rhynocoris fuscipes TaxID=488301 RepID=A0AAW1D7P1_9HEMI
MLIHVVKWSQLSASEEMPKPSLEILEQPQSLYRFRYLTEFKDNPHGPLTGQNSSKVYKTFPTVRLKNYCKKAIIRCWLCVNSNGKNVHIHQLLTKNDGRGIRNEPHDVVVDTTNNFTAQFEGLNIIHAVTKGKKYLEGFHEKKCFINSGYELNKLVYPYNEAELKQEVKNMEKNKAVLYFEAFDYETHEKLGCDIFSHEIKNSKNPHTSTLKIARQSVTCGKVSGGTEVIIFVEKVTKDVKIMFSERNGPWKEEAEIVEIWHQVAIAFRTPAYKDLSIDQDKEVFFQLVRESDNSFSNEMPFSYRPAQTTQPKYCEPVIGKKRRIDEDLSSVGVPSYPYSPPLSEQNYNSEIDSFYNSQDCVFHVMSNDDPFLQDCNEKLRGGGVLPGIMDYTYGVPRTECTIELGPGLESDGVGGHGHISESNEPFVDEARKHISAENEDDVEQKEYKLAKNLFQLILKEDNPSFTKFNDILKNLSHEKLIHFRNIFNKTPIHMAIENKKFDYLEPLVLAGIDVNALDVDGNSSLHLAILHDAQPKIISFLLEKGANTNLFNTDGETPIHLACRLGRKLQLEYLLPSMRSFTEHLSIKTGDTPLHVAVQHGHFDLVSPLLKKVPILFPNKGGYTSLDLAIIKEDDRIVKLLLSHMDPKERKNIVIVNIILTKVKSDMMFELLMDYMRRAGEEPDFVSIKYENKLSSDLNEKCIIKRLL